MAGCMVTETLCSLRLRPFVRLENISMVQHGGNKPVVQLRTFAAQSKRLRRLEKLGIGPDGKPLPIANPKNIFPRLYKCLLVNQDGSTYHIYHHYPHKIITLPLDPSTLSEEEREAREKKKRRSKEYRYVSEEDNLDDEWNHSQYEDLLR